MEFYIGQIFDGIYPPEAAQWCNQRQDCYIAEIESGPAEVEIDTEDIDGNKSTHTETQIVRRFQIMEIPPETEQEKRKRLDMLSLSKREVFLALYKTKNITPEQLKAQITDPTALIEFEYANDYYRGNPLINLIGEQLGFTSDDLDYLFQNKEFPEQTESVEE